VLGWAREIPIDTADVGVTRLPPFGPEPVHPSFSCTRSAPSSICSRSSYRIFPSEINVPAMLVVHVIIFIYLLSRWPSGSGSPARRS